MLSDTPLTERESGLMLKIAELMDEIAALKAENRALSATNDGHEEMIDELKAEVKTWKAAYNAADTGQRDALAKLAKTMQALRWYLQFEDVSGKARAVLAEIEGKGDGDV